MQFFGVMERNSIYQKDKVIAILLRHGANPVLNPSGTNGVIEGMIRRVLDAEPWDKTEAEFYSLFITLTQEL